MPLDRARAKAVQIADGCDAPPGRPASLSRARPAPQTPWTRKSCAFALCAAGLAAAGLTLDAAPADAQPAPALFAEDPARPLPVDLKNLPRLGGGGPAPCRDRDGVCTWERTVGGEREDKIYAVSPTPDGGFVTAGSTKSHGARGEDGWLLRLTGDGRLLWERRYGGPAVEQIYGLAPTPDGGVLAAGHTRSSGAGESDVWLLRLDPNGERMWEAVFGGPANDRARAVAAAPDGGFFVVGFTASSGAGDRDIWVLRVDATGALMWDRRFGGSGNDAAFAVTATRDGGAAVAGHVWSAESGFDMIALRLEPDGAPDWRRIVDRSSFDVGTAVVETADGGVAVVGPTLGARLGDDDLLLAKFTSEGEELWERRLGGSRQDTPWGLAALPSGGVLVAAATASQGAGSADAWILRFDAAGALAWERVFGGGWWDLPTAISPTEGEGMLVVGYTTSQGAGFEDGWMFRLDAQGRRDGR